jgi:hypothetical protein
MSRIENLTNPLAYAQAVRRERMKARPRSARPVSRAGKRGKQSPVVDLFIALAMYAVIATAMLLTGAS